MNDLGNPDLQTALPHLAEDINRFQSLADQLGETEADRSAELLSEMRRKLDDAQSAWDELHQIELERRPGQSFLGLMQRDFPRAGQGSINDIRGLTTQAVAHSPGLSKESGEPIDTPYAYVSNLFAQINSLSVWLQDQTDHLAAELYSEE